MLYRPNWVKVDGITYQKPCAVLLGVDDDYPLFGRLDDNITSKLTNCNVEYRDGTKSKGDKIGMPCTHSTVI